VRKQQTFDWIDADPIEDNVARLTAYHRIVRRSTYYIKGVVRLWYLKRDGATQGRIPRSSLSLTYMALHRLSEIARYSPDALARHFEAQHNWLLSEFISLALDQYLDELAAELTGHEFMSRGYSPR